MLEVAPAHPVAPSDNSGILAAAAAARSCSALVQPLRWAAVVDAAIRQYFALSDPIPRLYYVRNGRHIEVAKSSLTPETYPHLMYALSEKDPETDTVVHVLGIRPGLARLVQRRVTPARAVLGAAIGHPHRGGAGLARCSDGRERICVPDVAHAPQLARRR